MSTAALRETTASSTSPPHRPLPLCCPSDRYKCSIYDVLVREGVVAGEPTTSAACDSSVASSGIGSAYNKGAMRTPSNGSGPLSVGGVAGGRGTPSFMRATAPVSPFCHDSFRFEDVVDTLASRNKSEEDRRHKDNKKRSKPVRPGKKSTASTRNIRSSGEDEGGKEGLGGKLALPPFYDQGAKESFSEDIVGCKRTSMTQVDSFEETEGDSGNNSTNTISDGDDDEDSDAIASFLRSALLLESLEPEYVFGKALRFANYLMDEEAKARENARLVRAQEVRNQRRLAVRERHAVIMKGGSGGPFQVGGSGGGGGGGSGMQRVGLSGLDGGHVVGDSSPLASSQHRAAGGGGYRGAFANVSPPSIPPSWEPTPMLIPTAVWSSVPPFQHCEVNMPPLSPSEVRGFEDYDDDDEEEEEDDEGDTYATLGRAALSNDALSGQSSGVYVGSTPHLAMPPIFSASQSVALHQSYCSGFYRNTNTVPLTSGAAGPGGASHAHGGALLRGTAVVSIPQSTTSPTILSHGEVSSTIASSCATTSMLALAAQPYPQPPALPTSGAVVPVDVGAVQCTCVCSNGAARAYRLPSGYTVGRHSGLSCGKRGNGLGASTISPYNNNNRGGVVEAMSALNHNQNALHHTSSRLAAYQHQQQQQQWPHNNSIISYGSSTYNNDPQVEGEGEGGEHGDECDSCSSTAAIGIGILDTNSISLPNAPNTVPTAVPATKVALSGCVCGCVCPAHVLNESSPYACPSRGEGGSRVGTVSRANGSLGGPPYCLTEFTARAGSFVGTGMGMGVGSVSGGSGGGRGPWDGSSTMVSIDGQDDLTDIPMFPPPPEHHPLTSFCKTFCKAGVRSLERYCATIQRMSAVVDESAPVIACLFVRLHKKVLQMLLNVLWARRQFHLANAQSPEAGQGALDGGFEANSPNAIRGKTRGYRKGVLTGLGQGANGVDRALDSPQGLRGANTPQQNLSYYPAISAHHQGSPTTELSPYAPPSLAQAATNYTSVNDTYYSPTECDTQLLPSPSYRTVAATRASSGLVDSPPMTMIAVAVPYGQRGTSCTPHDGEGSKRGNDSVESPTGSSQLLSIHTSRAMSRHATPQPQTSALLPNTNKPPSALKGVADGGFHGQGRSIRINGTLCSPEEATVYRRLERLFTIPMPVTACNRLLVACIMLGTKVCSDKRHNCKYYATLSGLGSEQTDLPLYEQEALKVLGFESLFVDSGHLDELILHEHNNPTNTTAADGRVVRESSTKANYRHCIDRQDTVSVPPSGSGAGGSFTVDSNTNKESAKVLECKPTNPIPLVPNKAEVPSAGQSIEEEGRSMRSVSGINLVSYTNSVSTSPTKADLRAALPLPLSTFPVAYRQRATCHESQHTTVRTETLAVDTSEGSPSLMKGTKSDDGGLFFSLMSNTSGAFSAGSDAEGKEDHQSPTSISAPAALECIDNVVGGVRSGVSTSEHAETTSDKVNVAVQSGEDGQLHSRSSLSAISRSFADALDDSRPAGKISGRVSLETVETVYAHAEVTQHIRSLQSTAALQSKNRYGPSGDPHNLVNQSFRSDGGPCMRTDSDSSPTGSSPTGMGVPRTSTGTAVFEAVSSSSAADETATPTSSAVHVAAAVPRTEEKGALNSNLEEGPSASSPFVVNENTKLRAFSTHETATGSKWITTAVSTNTRFNGQYSSSPQCIDLYHYSQWVTSSSSTAGGGIGHVSCSIPISVGTSADSSHTHHSRRNILSKPHAAQMHVGIDKFAPTSVTTTTTTPFSPHPLAGDAGQSPSFPTSASTCGSFAHQPGITSPFGSFPNTPPVATALGSPPLACRTPPMGLTSGDLSHLRGYTMTLRMGTETGTAEEFYSNQPHHNTCGQRRRRRSSTHTGGFMSDGVASEASSTFTTLVQKMRTVPNYDGITAPSVPLGDWFKGIAVSHIDGDDREEALNTSGAGPSGGSSGEEWGRDKENGRDGSATPHSTTHIYDENALKLTLERGAKGPAIRAKIGTGDRESGGRDVTPCHVDPPQLMACTTIDSCPTVEATRRTRQIPATLFSSTATTTATTTTTNTTSTTPMSTVGGVASATACCSSASLGHTCTTTSSDHCAAPPPPSSSRSSDALSKQGGAATPTAATPRTTALPGTVRTPTITVTTTTSTAPAVSTLATSSTLVTSSTAATRTATRMGAFRGTLFTARSAAASPTAKSEPLLGTLAARVGGLLPTTNTCSPPFHDGMGKVGIFPKTAPFSSAGAAPFQSVLPNGVANPEKEVTVAVQEKEEDDIGVPAPILNNTATNTNNSTTTAGGTYVVAQVVRHVPLNFEDYM